LLYFVPEAGVVYGTWHVSLCVVRVSFIAFFVAS
jgi:hypothetical protein